MPGRAALGLGDDCCIAEESHPSDFNGDGVGVGVGAGVGVSLALCFWLCLSHTSLVLWSTGQAAAGSSVAVII
jgi:hypothetical protein